MADHYTCFVCGYPGLYDSPNGGSYEICPSCGFQFGYDDAGNDTFGTAWRQRWINAGMPWWSQNESRPKPDDWDPVAQLRQLDVNPDP